ncbi:MAG: threonine synthase [Rhodospirillales bacterium]
MKYVSTRGQAPVLSFEDVLLAGLARDGGLYVPEYWPQMTHDDIRALAGLPYHEVAFRVMWPFIGRCLSEDDFGELLGESYRGFDHTAVAPLIQLGPNTWLLELFHGPTLSFKDYALQMVGRLFDVVLKRRGENNKITIVGATSGDTGSAAIEACRDRDAIEVFMLHPKDRVSDVQRRQMTTVLSPNVHNIAIEGTFDDCQELVKQLFNDIEFRDQANLSAVNSINWARIMAQISYYFYVAVSIGAPERHMTFAVPTGNFGNIFAGYAAREMGLPVDKLVIGSNQNDILTRYIQTGEMKIETVHTTLSPSMDIQISSNFERLLFEYYDRDGAAVADVMEQFKKTGSVNFGQDRWKRMTSLFAAHAIDDEQTKAVIRSTFKNTGELLDPHTAVGLAAGIANHEHSTSALVSIATAHAAKFPAAVEDATGVIPALPESLAGLHEREERYTVMPNNVDTLREHMKDQIAKRASV